MKEQFPIFRYHPELTYLDSAATAHKPDCVIDAMTHFLQRDYATVHRAAYRSSVRATELYHAAREGVRHFLNASHVDEIVFTRGTTDAINLVARAFPFQPGDEIVLSQLEHHANLVPWQMAARERGAVLKWIPLQANGSLSSELPLSPRTKIVAVTHCSNVTGAIASLAPLVQTARHVGALVLVDGAQAAAHLSVDVQALGIDFYAFSGHKCYGPTGIGILYGKKEALHRLSPLQGGGDMVDRVFPEKSTYQPPPLCFEAGTPNLIGAVGLKVALEFLQTAVYPPLLIPALALLHQIPGVRILGTPEIPLITFSIEGVHPLDLAGFLDSHQIAIRTGTLCAQPLLRFFGCEHAARISMGVYNTEEDLDRFAKILREGIRILQR
jgi:cysteine desulfurase / selenocysteine lyase